ncbi:MAG: cobalamin B12-binding domain-containing protein [Chloroflexota bacterium]
MSTDKVRVLLAKPGLDGHELGAMAVARGLRDAGMEIVYTGLHQTPEQIVSAAIQEDVDVIGTSIYSGAHVGLMRKVMERLKEKGVAGQFLVIVGGAIPLEDVPKLKSLGVAEVFSSRASVEDIARFIKQAVQAASERKGHGQG